MAIVLHDLAGAHDDLRASPYCWRLKLALAHKGLAFETVPTRFFELKSLPLANAVFPTLVVDGVARTNSWELANWLEDAYPDRPSLFGGPAARALTAFYSDWTDRAFVPAMFKFIAVDLLSSMHPDDRAYFRAIREKQTGLPLEQFVADRDAALPMFRRAFLLPLRLALVDQPFLGGAAPLHADHVVWSVFQWARAASPFRILEPDDPIFAWRARMNAAYGGLGETTRLHAL